MTASLPEKVVKYSQTAVFTDRTVPGKLTSVHDTKPGVWGRLVVLEGALDYVIAGPPELRERVEAGASTIIEPEVKHRVDMTGPVSFQVEFYRYPKQAG